MKEDVREFLEDHLESIRRNDLERYRETTSQDLSLYEWWVTPHRIDGLPFHEFMMEASARAGTVLGKATSDELDVRFDLANLRIQQYEDTAIASYTLLISSSLPEGVQVDAHNESRVMVRIDGKWKVVHVHKSPAYPAAYSSPQS